MDLHPADADDRTWADARYVEIDFVPLAPTHELVVAWIAGERVGVGRIVPADADSGELGGMYVAPVARGRGVADAIVRHLLRTTHRRTLYCIPFADLSGLYERCGFRRLDGTAALPSAVADKLAYCRGHYPRPVTLLRWDRG
ncbi:MAG: GNAT family N-acetyltransferase [Myxococcota bacterium]